MNFNPVKERQKSLKIVIKETYFPINIENKKANNQSFYIDIHIATTLQNKHLSIYHLTRKVTKYDSLI